MSRRFSVLLPLALFLFVGCSEKLPEGLHRADSRDFTRDEARAVAVEKADLEKSGHKRIDARYSVARVPEGYRVHVAYVSGYHRGQPLFVPGGFCELLVSTQWMVIRIFPGA